MSVCSAAYRHSCLYGVHAAAADVHPSVAAQDPLGLGKTESSLERFTEAELMNGRWAMLGVAGALVPEVLGLGDWWSAPLWVSLPHTCCLRLAADADPTVIKHATQCFCLLPSPCS